MTLVMPCRAQIAHASHWRPSSSRTATTPALPTRQRRIRQQGQPARCHGSHATVGGDLFAPLSSEHGGDDHHHHHHRHHHHHHHHPHHHHHHHNTEEEDEGQGSAVYITYLGVACNLFLSAIKAVAGIAAGSTALLADAFHSISDLVTDFITLFGVKLGNKGADETFPYGYGRWETLCTAAVASLLIVGALSIFHQSVSQLANSLGVYIGQAGILGGLFEGGHMHHHHGSLGGLTLTENSMLLKIAMAIAASSIVIKELLFRATKAIGERINSQVLIANAWHHRSDAYTSVVSLVGLAGSNLGLTFFDPLCGLFVTFIIFRMGLSIAKQTLHELTDGSVPQSVLSRIEEVAMQVKAVEKVEDIRARRMGRYVVSDMSVYIKAENTLLEAQSILDATEKAIQERYPPIREVNIRLQVV